MLKKNSVVNLTEKLEGRRKNKKKGNRDSEARQRVRAIERRDYPRHADADAHARRRESTQTQYGLPHADAAIITLSCRRCQLLEPSQVKVMAMNHVRLIRSIAITREAMGVVSRRTYSSGKAKKGSKGSAASDAPKESILSKEVKSTTVVGANILKDGADPKILPDSEYPDWLWHLIDKKTALSELRRKNTETLPYEDLKRFVKLDNRARIKENNSLKAKN